MTSSKVQGGNDLLGDGPLSASSDRAFRESLRRFTRSDTLTASASLVGFILLLTVGFGLWLGPTFLNGSSLLFDVYQSTPEILIALGVVVCMAAGQFDLSVGAMATLGCFLAIGLHSNQGLPEGLAIAIAVAAGVVGGSLNAFLVVRLGVNAFIATLGTSGIIDGVGYVYSGGQLVTSGSGAHALPTWFTGITAYSSFHEVVPRFGAIILIAVLLASMVTSIWEFTLVHAMRSRHKIQVLVATAAFIVFVFVGAIVTHIWTEISWQVGLLLVLAELIWFFMKYVPTGRRIYAIGSNATAARLANIHVRRLTWLSFCVSGAFAALAGVLIAADQGSAIPGIGDGYLLPAYAAVFLSTVLISHGRFHVWGTVGGGLILVFVAEGLLEGGVPFTWNDFINGAVLVLAVALSTVLRRQQ